MGKRANIARTARNTEATAKGVAALRWQERRGQLVEQGLIEFNTADGVVRALERRLAQQRGERVEPIGNPRRGRIVGWVGLALIITAMALMGTATEAGAGVGFPMFMVALVASGAGFASAAKAKRLRSDEAEFAAYEARRRPVDAPTVALPAATAPITTTARKPMSTGRHAR